MPRRYRPNRRQFLTSAAMLPAMYALQPSQLTVDTERLRRRIEALSVFGRPAGGSFADGVSRLGYSDADVAGRAAIMQQMREAGASPWIDAAGNIFATRPGTARDVEPVLFGSHIDSVPNGGNFDGDLGSLAAVEILQVLGERRISTRRSLQIVVWANEEGVAFGNGLCGSRAAAGELVEGELDEVWNGVKKSDAVRHIGGDPARIDTARLPKSMFATYLELHIEQGGTLERNRIDVGVVEGIVAIDRYEAVVTGVANHAGTTAMPDRHDALVAASQLVLAVREIVTRDPGRQVGTVGHLTVTPNAPNVIPGAVRHTIELRDLASDTLARLARDIHARASQIASSTGTTIEIRRTSRHDSAMATPAVQDAIESAARSGGFSTRRMPSGAGHDAQMMARLGPMGMIFVPSVGGISHSPGELTTWVDCGKGADVLLQTVLALAG